MNSPAVPVGLLIRALKLCGPHSALDASARWSATGQLVVSYPDGHSLTFSPVDRQKLIDRYGNRVGDVTSAWWVSDQRLILVRPDGGTVSWTVDQPAFDEGARMMAEIAESRAVAQAA